MAKKDKEKMLFAGIRKGIIDNNRICKEVEIYTDGYKLYLKYERKPDTCAVCGEHTHSRILCNGKPVCRQCMIKMKEWSENYQTQKIHLLDTGYASAVSLSGNRYLVFIPQDLTDTMENYLMMNSWLSMTEMNRIIIAISVARLMHHLK